MIGLLRVLVRGFRRLGARILGLGPSLLDVLFWSPKRRLSLEIQRLKALVILPSWSTLEEQGVVVAVEQVRRPAGA